MATEKQKRAVQNMVENGGNVSRAMIDAGYSPATAKNPSKLTMSKAYEELMDSYLPDDMLLRSLADDIEKKAGNRKAELELAFKLKGKMVEKRDVTSDGQPLIINVPGSLADTFDLHAGADTETGGVSKEQE